MKKCTYCGKEYPDEAMVCAIDNEPLSGGSLPPLQTQEAEASRISTEDSSLKRPKGVWIVTGWMFLFPGLLTILVSFVMYFGPKELKGLMPLINLIFGLLFATGIMVVAIAAWLGHLWARYALIALALGHYSIIAYNLYNFGQSGVVPTAKMYLVWARMLRALLTMTLIVSYLSLSENAKIFFRDYRSRSLNGGT